jgi:hypothetical protein
MRDSGGRDQRQPGSAVRREGSKIFVCSMPRKNYNPELRATAGLRGQSGQASHGHDARLGPGGSNNRLRGRL